MEEGGELMFQFKLIFRTENNTLPKEMDRLFVSFLKAAAQNYSQRFFDQLYDKSKSIMKEYAYSCYLPGAKFLTDKVLLNQNGFTLFFSDANLGESIQFFNAFKSMKFKQYPMNHNSMQLVSVTMQKKQEIVDSEVIIKMQSSLIVRRHNSEDNSDVYFTFDHKEFGQALKENVDFFLSKCEVPITTEGFSITPIKAKKIVTPVFGRNTDANIGVYKLTGSPELLNFLYLSGIGVRRGEGHGKFEVIL